METNQNQNRNSSKPNKEKDSSFSFLKFTGIAFEMLGFVLIGYWIGSQLDKYFETGPILTLVSIMLGITGAMINLFRKLPKY